MLPLKHIELNAMPTVNNDRVHKYLQWYYFNLQYICLIWRYVYIIESAGICVASWLLADSLFQANLSTQDYTLKPFALLMFGSTKINIQQKKYLIFITLRVCVRVICV